MKWNDAPLTIMFIVNAKSTQPKQNRERAAVIVSLRHLKRQCKNQQPYADHLQTKLSHIKVTFI